MIALFGAQLALPTSPIVHCNLLYCFKIALGLAVKMAEWESDGPELVSHLYGPEASSVLCLPTFFMVLETMRLE